MEILKGNKISLRAVEPSDLDSLYLWENDTESWPSGANRAPLSRHLLWNYIQNYRADIFSERCIRLIITDNAADDTPVGLVELYDYDPRDRRAMLGIYVAKASRRRGFAREALALTADYARRVVDMHQLAVIVAEDNRESLRLFTDAGYKSSGKLRSWLRHDGLYHDAVIMQLLFPY